MAIFFGETPTRGQKGRLRVSLALFAQRFVFEVSHHRRKTAEARAGTIYRSISTGDHKPPRRYQSPCLGRKCDRLKKIR